ncbi:MAG TPA: flavodoxin domain-containing protein [Micromonosporaceae bacterium]|nr:flavodoxin domain-containing protein [Micromonosporaceae bacterium]
MRALVVYESMLGNTEEIAQIIAEGLATDMVVQAVEVGIAPSAPTVDLLVVGAPTHAFGLSRPSTRSSAAAEAARTGRAVVSRRFGIREWLAALRPDGVRMAAAFDTRVRKPRLPGSAARAALRRLRRLGISCPEPAMSFYVETAVGPLSAGERDRARRWAEMLAKALLAANAPSRR